MVRAQRLLIAAIVGLLLAMSSGVVQPQEGEPARGWKTESVKLREGRELAGVFLTETDDEIEFAEFVRRPGRPIFFVVRSLEKSDIVQMNRLSSPERAELLGRYNRLRTRAAVELGRMDKVRLDRAAGRPARFSYRGKWFSLLSTADAETTKRCVVRIEQIVRAYRQWLPPRRKPTRQLRLLVFGEMEEYRSFLRQRGWDVRNPAFYVPDLNMIVAGSDVSRYAQRLAEARRHSQALLKKYKAIDATFTINLKDVQKQLQQAGFSDRQIKSELALRKKRWDDELKEIQREITRVNRQNETRFRGVTRQMFSRLYHEAFHAYLENHVYPKEKGQLPSWLNEGLAQIFESGQLEDDALRIEGTNAAALRRLRRDIGRRDLMPLSMVLGTDQRAFLRKHAESSSSRSYAYSWALARFLVSDFGLLRQDRLDRFLTTERENGMAALSALVGMPLGQFEAKWHNAIRQWK